MLLWGLSIEGLDGRIIGASDATSKVYDTKMIQ